MKHTRIRVAILPELICKEWISDRSLAIIVDQLRFTSTACQALAAGARSISVARNAEQATEMAAGIGFDALRCGERFCGKIEGFDLGNSPFEYTPEIVSGRQLIFSTTNGTAAVLAVANLQLVALGCLLNRKAIVEYSLRLIAESIIDSVYIVCAGTDGQIAAEDMLAAGAIVDLISASLYTQAVVDDSAVIARDCWLAQGEQPRQLEIERWMSSTLGGRNLIAAGFESDLAFVSQIDLLNSVPVRSLALESPVVPVFESHQDEQPDIAK